MTVCTETIEFKLAAKEVRKLELQGFGYYQCVQSAMRLVVGQGFGQEYAQQVAEDAWDLVCAN
jgi:hypothetical protein